MRLRVLLLVMFSFVLVGCQTTAQTSPPNPSYVVNGAKQQTKEALVAVLLGAGYHINKDSDFQLVFDKPADSLAVQLLLGSRFNSKPNFRISLAFLGGSPTRVSTRLHIVTNPNSGVEKITDLTHSPKAQARMKGYIDQANALVASGV